jgi:hypothetical protein
MPEVFLSFASPDRDVASQIAVYLEQATAARMVVDPCDGGAGIAEGWEGGLGAQAIVLLLSGDSVPSGLSREQWDPLLAHVTGNHVPPVALVWVGDCKPPKLLERGCRFSWQERPGIETLRTLGRWVTQVAAERESHSFVPAAVPGFTGREQELDTLWRLLVDRPGTVVVVGDEDCGKTALAQQFAYQAAVHFQDVVWGDSLPATAGRTLHIRDHSESVLVGPDSVSTIVTCRSLPPNAGGVHVLRVEPLGLDLPAPPPMDADALRMWQGLALCHRHMLLRELAAGIAGLDLIPATAAMDALLAQRLADPVDESGVFARLSAGSQRAALLSRATTGTEALRRRHAELVLARFQRWSDNPDGCEPYLPELPAALEWSRRVDWPLAADLALRAADYQRMRRRNAEATDLLRPTLAQAVALGDNRIREQCEWELSWLEETPGGGIRPGLPAQEQLALFS